MPSRIAPIADALVVWLNDRTARNWASGLPTWQARRVWEAIEDVSTADGLLVQVAAIGRQELTLLARQSKTQRYEHEIYIRQKYADAGDVPNEWVDQRVWLVEEIEDKLFDMIESPPTNVQNVFVPAEGGITVSTYCDQFDLHETRQFTAIMSVILQEIRSR